MAKYFFISFYFGPFIWIHFSSYFSMSLLMKEIPGWAKHKIPDIESEYEKFQQKEKEIELFIHLSINLGTNAGLNISL